MDCDYDPNNVQKELIENSKGKRKRRRKSKFAKMLSESRPPFDPNDKTYEEYVDEYYKFDCEDIIGDIPCRFKYRKVPANSFGLSVEEILLAKDRELNRWCSLKKAVQIRPENQEKYDQIAYERKGKNFELKKKILPSLFEPDENVGAEKEKVKEEAATSGVVSKKRKRKKANQENTKSDTENKATEESSTGIQEKHNDLPKSDVVNNEGRQTRKKPKRKNATAGQSENSNPPQKNSNADTYNKKRKINVGDAEIPNKRQKKTGKAKKSKVDVGISDARLSAYGINAKKFKNKLKYGNQK